MIILERLLTRSDDELREFLVLIYENKNKNARWEAFKDTPLRKALEVEYPVGKREFFYPRGLEALGREFVSKRGELIRFDVSGKYGFRAVVEQEILDLKDQGGSGRSQVSSAPPVTPRASRKDSDRDDS